MAKNNIRVPCRVIENQQPKLGFVSVLEFLKIARELNKFFVNKCKTVNDKRKLKQLDHISVRTFIM